MSFHQSALLPLTAPVIHSVVGDAGLHYPTFFLTLPYVFSRVSLVLSIVTSIAVAVATIMFAGVFRGQDWRAPWRTSWKRYPALIVTTALLAVLLYLVSKAMGLVPVHAQATSTLARWGTRAVMVFAFVIIQTFLIYTTAWIVLRGASAVASVGRSIRVAWNTFLTTLILVTVPVLLVFPLDYATGRTDWMIGKFRPELVTWILMVEILVELVLGFILVGATTRIFIYQVEETR